VFGFGAEFSSEFRVYSSNQKALRQFSRGPGGHPLSCLYRFHRQYYTTRILLSYQASRDLKGILRNAAMLAGPLTPRHKQMHGVRR
jgi:hypothetical protein